MRTVATVSIWIVVSALVVVLAVQNRGLREQRDLLAYRAQFAYPGMYVPEIAVTTLDGVALTLGAPQGRRQVVFFFDHTCPYCARSGEHVAAAARALRARHRERVSMLGVCRCAPDQARAFAARYRFDFPLVALRDQRSLALYRARAVPALLAIGEDGRVVHAVQGLFETQAQFDALMAAVGDQPPPTRPTGSNDGDDRRG